MKKEDKKRDPMPPPNATPEEIGEFWDTHDLADYWDETEEVEFQIDLRSEREQTQSDEAKPDLSATTIDGSSDVLDTATDLALDSTIPIPIRRNVLKALDRLGSTLIDIPVGALERRSAEKRAESEARIKITETVNAQIIEQIKVDPEFPQRASNTFAKKILREQYNLEKILSIAADILKGKKYDNSTNQQSDNEAEKSIDDDWFNIFEKEASQKSTEEMQHRFARVLAGEIEKPRSYSIKAIKILGELDQYAAALFKKLCSACMVIGIPNSKILIDARVPSLGGKAGTGALGKYGLNFSQLNILNEHGLIISDYDTWLTGDGIIEYQDNPAPLQFYHQGSTWILLPLPERDNKTEFRLSGVVLSEVGRELFHIVDQDPTPEYTEALKKFFANQKLKMVQIPRE